MVWSMYVKKVCYVCSRAKRHSTSTTHYLSNRLARKTYITYVLFTHFDIPTSTNLLALVRS